MMCDKCGIGMGVVVLILGILFLLQDLAIWNFWNIQWWTAAFILVGISGIACSKCSNCQTTMKKK